MKRPWSSVPSGWYTDATRARVAAVDAAAVVDQEPSDGLLVEQALQRVVDLASLARERGGVTQETRPSHLDIEGCFNVRDAGGWGTADGRWMRTGGLVPRR